MQIYIRTHGCRLNAAESRWIEEEFMAEGHQIVDSIGKKFDVAVVNTCAVTNEAESKCLQTIRQIIKANPNAVLIITGCLAEKNSEIFKNLADRVLVLGNSEKHHIIEHFNSFLANPENLKIQKNTIPQKTFSIPCKPDSSFYNQRYNLKIQEGCDFFCSYCIIPRLRGRARSRSFDNILEDARIHVQKGVKELVLTGVNIGTYEDNGNNLSHLIESLNNIDGLERIRLSSIEFKTIPEGMIEQMADTKNKLVPYLHLPLQSASNRILKLMRRHYQVEEFKDYLNYVVETIPGVGLGTDIIVGFPGETEVDFQESIEFVKKSPLNYAHVFSYSPRSGTVASLMKDHFIQREEIENRSRLLRKESQKKRLQFYHQLIGQSKNVLLENYHRYHYPSLTENYAKVRIYMPQIPGFENSLKTVRIVGIKDNDLEGVIV